MFIAASAEHFNHFATFTITMPSPANMDIVERINSRASLSQAMKDKSEGTCDEKARDVIVDCAERQPRPRLQGRVQKIRGGVNRKSFASLGAVIWKFGRFMGPGTIISVAYIDPDNFQTAVTSGAQFKYKLLFMVLVSNVIAIFLQVCHFTSNTDRMLSI